MRLESQGKLKETGVNRRASAISSRTLLSGLHARALI